MGRQRMGLKYFEDLRQRIPREEVAAIEAEVREAVLGVLQCRDSPDQGSLFCRAVGRWAAHQRTSTAHAFECDPLHI
jgi:hypothetical protein